MSIERRHLDALMEVVHFCGNPFSGSIRVPVEIRELINIVGAAVEQSEEIGPVAGPARQLASVHTACVTLNDMLQSDPRFMTNYINSRFSVNESLADLGKSKGYQLIGQDKEEIGGLGVINALFGRHPESGFGYIVCITDKNRGHRPMLFLPNPHVYGWKIAKEYIFDGCGFTWEEVTTTDEEE